MRLDSQLILIGGHQLYHTHDVSLHVSNLLVEYAQRAVDRQPERRDGSQQNEDRQAVSQRGE